MHNLKSVSVIRLGEHNKNKRVWIVNKSVQEVFAIGQKVKVDYDAVNRCIQITKPMPGEGNHTISHRNKKTPVIDIKNQKVEETFGSDVEKVEVLYFSDRIVLKVSKNDIFKKKRSQKKGMRTFELFSGAGTLSKFFEEAGFNIVGGLELSEDYQSLYCENHPGEEVYTIMGRLEDIHSSYFPRNVDVVLSGIPCTSYTGANKLIKEAQKAMREGKEYDREQIMKVHEADALTYYVLNAIRMMNPRVCVIEEVEEYSQTNASWLARTVLSQMGYHLSEVVSQSVHTKRTRWCLVASMDGKVNLEDLLPEDDGKCIEDLLEIPVGEREWKPKEEFAPSRLNEKVGIRSFLPSDKKTNTFTTHYTRATEPIMKHETQELYSELSNREIANIHGLPESFVLDERKSTSRQILGQGVADMFKYVAERIQKQSSQEHLAS